MSGRKKARDICTMMGMLFMTVLGGASGDYELAYCKVGELDVPLNKSTHRIEDMGGGSYGMVSLSDGAVATSFSYRPMTEETTFGSYEEFQNAPFLKGTPTSAIALVERPNAYEAYMLDFSGTPDSSGKPYAEYDVMVFPKPGSERDDFAYRFNFLKGDGYMVDPMCYGGVMEAVGGLTGEPDRTFGTASWLLNNTYDEGVKRSTSQPPNEAQERD